jgi:hypothetical protein
MVHHHVGEDGLAPIVPASASPLLYYSRGMSLRIRRTQGHLTSTATLRRLEQPNFFSYDAISCRFTIILFANDSLR